MNAENEKESVEEELTQLLNAQPSRQDELYEFVYNHLKAIARNRLAGENRQKSLETTDLVNEA